MGANWLSRMFTIPHAEQKQLAQVPGINVLAGAVQMLAISAAQSVVDQHEAAIGPSAAAVIKQGIALEVQHAIPIPKATADPIAIVESTVAAAHALPTVLPPVTPSLSVTPAQLPTAPAPASAQDLAMLTGLVGDLTKQMTALTQLIATAAGAQPTAAISASAAGS